jgi:hypothetical protein
MTAGVSFDKCKVLHLRHCNKLIRLLLLALFHFKGPLIQGKITNKLGVQIWIRR